MKHRWELANRSPLLCALGRIRSFWGQDLAEVIRHIEVSEPTYHRWRAQYGGMKADDAKRLREPERENGRLKQID